MNTESQTDQDRITQLEAACAAMRSALEGALKTVDVYCKQANAPGYSKGSLRDQWQQALSSDAGKSLLDRLQAVEKERDELKRLIDNARKYFPEMLGVKALQPAQKEQQ